MVYGLTCISIIVLIIINYKILFKDVLSPSLMTMIMFFVTIIFALVGLFTWNDVKDIDINLYIIIIIGLISFNFGELCIRKCSDKVETNCKEKENSKFLRINQVGYIKCVIVICILLFTIIYTFLQIKDICRNYGYINNSIAGMLKFFRVQNDMLSGGNISAEYDLNFVSKQLIKLSYVLTVYFEYIFVNAIMLKEKKKKILLYSIPILLGMICTLLSTGRSIFFHMVVAFVVIIAILYKEKCGNKFIITKKTIKFIVITVVVVISLLYGLMPLLGRTDTGGLIESTSFALGVHIPTFNKIIIEENTKNVIPEDIKLTFNNLYQTLYRLNIVDDFKESMNVWYSFGTYSSNTYTALYSQYHDYGIVGIIVLQFIFGFLSSYIYITTVNKKSVLLLVFYSYFFYTVVDQIRGDQFYSLFTSATIAYIALIVIVYYLLFKLKIKTNIVLIRGENENDRENQKL